MSASLTREGPEPFGEDSGREQAVASTICLLRAPSLLKSEDYLEMGDPRIGCVKYEGGSSIHLNLQQKETNDAPGLKIAILRSWDTWWPMSLGFSGS